MTRPDPAVEATRSGVDRNFLVHRVFKQVLQRIRAKTKDELFIFIDDLHLLPTKAGVSRLVKETTDARFVMIGVADTLGEMLTEPASQQRKIARGRLELPPLSEPEIKQLLDRAETVYPNTVSFSPEYRTALYNYCEGYPWLIHQIGYESIAKLQIRKDVIVLGADDAKAAAYAVASPEERDHRYQKMYQAVGQSTNKQKILFTLAREPYGWVTRRRLLEIIGTTPHGFHGHVEALAASGVVKRNEDRVKFVDPVFRILAKFAAERGHM